MVEPIERIMIRAEVFWQTVPAHRSMEHAAKRHSINDTAVDTKPYDATPNLTFACAVKRRWSSVGGKSHPGTGSLHPVAIGAVVEVTKLLKPLV